AAGPTGIVVAGVNTGGTFTFGGSSVANGAFVARFDASGDPVWAAAYDGCADGAMVEALAVAPNGTLILVGSCGDASPGARPRFLRGYDATGVPLWTHALGSMHYWQVNLATDSQSNVYVVGDSAYAPLDFGGTTVGPGTENEWAFIVKL